MNSTMRSAMMMFALACASAGCGGAQPLDSDVAEDELASTVALRATASLPELSKAVTEASADRDVPLKVETFSFDPARGRDPSRVITAVRNRLTHKKQRVDDGPIDAAGLRATLAEFEVTEGLHQAALAAGVKAAVGENPTTRKLWLRSDDVPGAESEWAEVVLVFVSPAKGTAVSLTVRLEL